MERGAEHQHQHQHQKLEFQHEGKKEEEAKLAQSSTVQRPPGGSTVLVITVTVLVFDQTARARRIRRIRLRCQYPHRSGIQYIYVQDNRIRRRREKKKKTEEENKRKEHLSHMIFLEWLLGTVNIIDFQQSSRIFDEPNSAHFAFSGSTKGSSSSTTSMGEFHLHQLNQQSQQRQLHQYSNSFPELHASTAVITQQQPRSNKFGATRTVYPRHVVAMGETFPAKRPRRFVATR